MVQVISSAKSLVVLVAFFANTVTEFVTPGNNSNTVATLAQGEEIYLPPSISGSWTRCYGIPSCRYCCLRLTCTLQGTVEYQMFQVIAGEVQPYPYASYTGSNVWNFGIIGDPDKFIVKYRNIGSSTWHQSREMSPPVNCCYP